MSEQARCSRKDKFNVGQVGVRSWVVWPNRPQKRSSNRMQQPDAATGCSRSHLQRGGAIDPTRRTFAQHRSRRLQPRWQRRRRRQLVPRCAARRCCCHRRRARCRGPPRAIIFPFFAQRDGRGACGDHPGKQVVGVGSVGRGFDDAVTLWSLAQNHPLQRHARTPGCRSARCAITQRHRPEACNVWVARGDAAGAGEQRLAVHGETRVVGRAPSESPYSRTYDGRHSGAVRKLASERVT